MNEPNQSFKQTHQYFIGQNKFKQAPSSTELPCFAKFPTWNTVDQKEQKPQVEQTSDNSIFQSQTQSADQTKRQESSSIPVNMQIFQQIQQVQDLMEQLPIKFKKKMRQVLEKYRKQRMMDKAQILRLNKCKSEKREQSKTIESLSKQIQVEISYDVKEDVAVNHDNNSKILLSEDAFYQLSRVSNNQQIIKMNQFIQFITEGFDHHRVILSNETNDLKIQISDKNKQINQQKILILNLKKQIETCQKEIAKYIHEASEFVAKKQEIQTLKKEIAQKSENTQLIIQLESLLAQKNQKINKSQSTISLLNLEISSYKEKSNGYVLQIQKLQDRLKQFDKFKNQNNKSIWQRRENMRMGSNLQNLSIQHAKSPSPMLTVNTAVKVRKQSHCRSPTSPDRHVRSRKISLRQQICNPRDFNFDKGLQDELVHSQCDSLEFGKEKVIQKRKVRKIFTNLISAPSSADKREALQKLALEIGLRIKDYEMIINNLES